MRTRLTLGTIMLVLCAACTPSDADQTTTTPPPAETAASQPTSTTTTLPPIAVDRGFDVEAGIVSIGLAGRWPDETVDGYARYWQAVNAAGGIDDVLVEVVAIPQPGDAPSLDVAAVSSGAPIDGVPVVANLVMADVYEAFAADPLRFAPEAEASGGVILVDVTSPDACRRVGEPFAVLEATEWDPATGPAAVFCTAPVGPDAIGVVAGVGAPALVLLPSAWRPAPDGVFPPDVPVRVVGVLPGPGTDDAPAGELIPAALGAGPWTPHELDGYGLARSMHAVLEIALTNRDLTRVGIEAATGEASGADFGFGPGVPVALPDSNSPTGLAVTSWITP